MGWVAFTLALLVGLILFWQIHRKWVSPWSQLEERVEEIGQGRTPSTFLISGSSQAQRVALALETVAARQQELLSLATEREFDVETIVSALPDCLLIVDKARRVRLKNLSCLKHFNVEPGMTFLEATRDARLDQLLGEVIDQGQARQGSMTTLRANNEPAEFEVIAEPIRTEKEIEGAVVLLRDVTELRRTEEVRRDFVANVSHELRTPLSILRGYLETLLADPKQPPAELLRILEVMERHSNRLNLLVEDVLSLARLEDRGAELDRQSIRLADFLREMLRDWEKKLAAKQLRAVIDAPADLPPLPADEGRLQEIIYNLLENAVKFSPKGETIILRAVQQDQDIVLSVTDHGTGISARDLPRIFERFYRADRARHRELGGTGLGLSIVKHIAQLHGGRVTAESTPGYGTTISVTLPLEGKEKESFVIQS